MTLTDGSETLLLRQPTVSQEHIAFIYAGDIWLAGRDGSTVRRLTAQKGVKSTPMFSPDGEWLAFTGNYDGNVSVYVISIVGGSPEKLTFHPGADWMRGWTPDGTHILFASSRDTVSARYNRLFTVPWTGGYPQPLPMPMAERGAYAPDASAIAYTPIADPFRSWKRYRGGQTTPIWIFDLATTTHQEIPHENASDTFPCWLGDTIYFMSDRNHTMNLFSYHTETKTVKQVTFHEDFDIRSVTAGGDVLAYEQGGRIYLFDPTTNEAQGVRIQIQPDLPETRPHYKKAARFITNAGLSPTGTRAVFEARGDIFTAPAKKGDIRNLTRTPGVHERYPAWSPDGKTIAYLSDAGGEYQLMLSDQKGMAEPKAISLGDPTFYYSPLWSPDSQKIAYTDKRLNLFYLDLTDQKPILVDTDTYDHPARSLAPVWSPDSQWLAYTKRLDTHIRAVFLYHVPTAQSHQMTDGLSDATSACFSRDGKHLFFAASSNYGLNTGWLDMSSLERPVDHTLYVAVLNKTDPSPLEPESDDEPDEAESGDAESENDDDNSDDDENDENDDPKKKEQEAVEVIIDLDGLDQRILALPMPARYYRSLQAGEDKLFYLEAKPNGEGFLLQYFDLKERKTETFLESVRAYWLSADGKKLLYRGNNSTFAIVETDKKPKPNDGLLKLDKMEVQVDPKAEWAQMFTEVTRIQRDFFYDAGMHGADWPALCETYRAFLPHVGHRDDLNYLFAELFGELVAGHAYVWGGDIPAPDSVSVGLLGADYEIVEGRYRIQRIYQGLNWYPELRAPLTEPGVAVDEGDYILAVNGRTLEAPTNIFRHFEKTADVITTLTISPTPNEADARTVTVVPIASEDGLRHWSWVEANRRTVDALSDGRVAYVYMPNTGTPGYSAFNRYYFSQLGREAVIIDERFNGGGLVADYVIDMLNRPVLSYWATREGKPFSTPNASIFGPKVMIINEYAGSGGDAMPYFFRRRNLGQLVGKRTWGGLIGIYDYPSLMDGGFVSAPRLAIFSSDGEWVVENEGVAPDVEVEMTPKLVIEGHDPQLEKAVELILAELARNPLPTVSRPPSARRV